MSFPALPCSTITLDTLDISGMVAVGGHMCSGRGYGAETMEQRLYESAIVHALLPSLLTLRKSCAGHHEVHHENAP
eukprot:scaffold99618_cov39-Tisochrysis_lutea.AAC.2